MAMPQVKMLIGWPLGDADRPLYSALNIGDLAPATTTEFVLSDEFGDRVVFHGNFTVSAGEVTGGTLTGYDVFVGSTKVLTATGYALDGAAMFEAVQNYGVDSQPFFDLTEGSAIKYIGSKFGDDVNGTDFSDVILGKAGADYLVGNDGNDQIKAGSGDDFLAGLSGSDKLWGGSGRDVFAFNVDLTEPPPTGFDKIKDFDHGKDVIGLSVFNGIDELIPQGYLDNKYFHKGTEAKTADQHVIYDKKTGSIWFDGDGNGADAQFLLAKVTAGTKLHADDFYAGTSLMA